MNDEELMAAVAQGDQLAYQTLVRKHLPSITRYALRLLGNSRDTEDIAQETFLRLWTTASRWDPSKAQLNTWLHRITHNLCIDFLRKQKRVTLTDNFDDEIAESESDATESFDALNQALSRLPEAQRSALLLCHYQGFSNKEAAAIMDITVKALESLIARAKRSLRTLLEANNNAN